MSERTEPIHVGVSWLRTLHAQGLRDLPPTPFVIHNHSEPISVLVRYDLFLEWQNVLLGRGVKGIDL